MSERAVRPPPSAEEYERVLARLEEVEELLRAIREGEVDALLIDGAEGRRVYTVSSADEPYRVLVEQMQEGAVTMTIGGAVLYCNPRFAALVRTPESRIVGKDMLPFIAPNDRDVFTALLAESAAGLGRVELSLLAADGTLVPVHISGNPITLAGEPTVCLVITDLTQQRQMAEILRQSQKVEAVGQLTAGVAHDFNNLLMAVLGNLEIAEIRARDPDLTRLIQAAGRAAQRGARLTEQLLAFSRKQRLEPKPTDINQIVTGMGELLRSTMGGIINVERVLSPDAWPALVDANQIELVILNLAINARDAMPRGGTLTIETSNLRLAVPEQPEGLPAGDYVMVLLRDTGTGMPPEVQAKAFEPFFTTKGPGKGSGLGLSMVQGVMAQLRGGVRIRSRVGEGTSVMLYLPRAPAAVSEGTDILSKRPEPSAVAGRAILLVDDDDDVREITAMFLREIGYRVVEAPSGNVALEILRSGEIVDVMVVDFAMPRMNGTDLAQSVRSILPGMPIVFATGYADIDGLASQLRGELIVSKPFRCDQLEEKIRAALDRGSESGSDALQLQPPAFKI